MTEKITEVNCAEEGDSSDKKGVLGGETVIKAFDKPLSSS